MQTKATSRRHLIIHAFFQREKENFANHLIPCIRMLKIRYCFSMAILLEQQKKEKKLTKKK